MDFQSHGGVGRGQKVYRTEFKKQEAHRQAPTGEGPVS
jgi:hypothetical protein